MPQGDGYIRVYYRIVEDPKFEGIFADDHHLATWLRLLLQADPLWPVPCPIPRRIRKASFDALVAAKLVDIMPNDCFRIHGLDAERAMRSASARNAAASRWHSAAQSGNDARPSPSPRPSPNPRPSTGSPSTQELLAPRHNGDPPKRGGFISTAAILKDFDLRPSADAARLTKAQLDAWSTFGSEWNGFKAAWIAKGLKWPPKGSPHDDPEATSPSQRALLYSILDARPTDLVKWVSEAPNRSSNGVIFHVLERWHGIREKVGNP